MLTYQIVSSDSPVSIPGHLSRYKCLILIERPVPEARRDEVSRLLVESGCLYVMVWGLDCSLWDDSIDCANIQQFEYREIPDAQFVMTTWHEGETIQEVLRFAKVGAAVSLASEPLNDLLVLDFSKVNRAPFVKAVYDRA